MKKKTYKRLRLSGKIMLLSCLLATLGGSDALAQREGFVNNSPRRTAMGGAGVALLGTDNAFFVNPALLARIERNRYEFLDVQIIFNQNSFGQYNFYRDHQDQFDNLDAMTDTERNRFYEDMLDVARDQTMFGFEGMAPLTVVRPGMSFGVFERALLDYDLSEGASAIPVIHAGAVAEGEVVFGLGREFMQIFGNPLCVGANAKYLYRAVSQESRTAPAVETIENIRVYRGWAIAFDLGLLMALDKWSFGVGVYDFNWPRIRWNVNEDPADGFRTPDEIIPGSSRLGVAYEPGVGIGILDDFKFAFDVESPLSEEMGFFKKLSFGAESRFAGLMRVRAGIHQGYPTAGAQVTLKVLNLEYAFGGEALGRHPGQRESWNHIFSLGFGWGY